MPNRLSPSKTRPEFGLLAWLEATRITLPLKGVECRFSVCGDLLNIEIDQIFHQNSSRSLDCLYSFPLPASAAVYRCEMHVNDRVIRARVEEIKRARELVREKKAAGYRTSLVEMERDNLFTLSLGNVQPDDTIVIRFAYFQTLTRLGDWTSFMIPFCPGVRYIPGTPLLRGASGRGVVDDTAEVPDASRISPPRIDRLHSDAAYLAIEGTIEHPLGNVRDITSPTHPVVVQDRTSASTIRSADRATVPDCDFVLRWTETPVTNLKPVGWAVKEEHETFALVRLEAPAATEADGDYAQDIYFLLDRSGSMEGLKWEKTAAAFREFVKVLGPKDRVWATLFESTFRDFAEKPMSPEDVLRDPMAQKLEKLGATGGTELMPALEHVLQKITTYSVGKPAALLLITDGQVGNEQQLLEHLRQYPDLRVHTFGIDLTVNDGFLKRIASEHRGTSFLLAPSDDIVGTVARLGARLRRPVLTAIQAAADWESPNGSLPDLHAGELLSLSLKGTVNASAIGFRGQWAGRNQKFYDFELVCKDVPAIRLLWAKRRIEHLLANGERDAAIELARKYNLICEGAAFVAWDEAEKVLVSAEDDETYQPSLEPKYVERFAQADLERGVQTLYRAQHETHFSDCLDASFFSELTDFAAPDRIAESVTDAAAFSTLEKWRNAIRSILFSSEGRALIDLLCEWAWEEPAEAPRRLLELESLRATLEKAATKPGDLLQVLERWIESNWKDHATFAERARPLLAKMKNSAPV
jgi:Ca-activated chloride channel family protein